MHVKLYTLNIHIIHFLCTRYYPGEQVLEWIRDVKYYFCSVGTLKLMGKKEKKKTITGCQALKQDVPYNRGGRKDSCFNSSPGRRTKTKEKFKKEVTLENKTNQ